MSKKPKLAIVGRPNVGKSALFNRICEKKIAIVDEAEGITRDRLYAPAEFFGFPFILIDTGGIDAKSKAPFNSEVKMQAEIAIEEADTLVMVVDAQIGLTQLDAEVANILLKAKKPVCLAVNKIDDLVHENLMHQFYPLGIKKMIPVSAVQGRNIAELLEIAFESIPKSEEEESPIPTTKVAVVGRPNVGKSTLINYLLDENRCIVSPIPGTTRDSVDVEVEYQGSHYTFIDTAGIRRKHAEHEVVDKFASIRTERAINRADVCVLLLDATEGFTTQEKHIANLIEEAGKGCVILLNKWDLVKGYRMEHCLKAIHEMASFLAHCPIIFISAKTGRNVEKLIDQIKEVHDASQVRITTPQLNKFIEMSLQRNHPPMLKGKRLRIYYMVQIDVQPPTFLFFVNQASLMMDTYRKYLFNQFRETFGFTGNPIVFHLKSKPKKKREETAKQEDSWEEPEEMDEDEEFLFSDEAEEL